MLQDGYGVTTLMSTNDPLDVATLTPLLIVLDEGRLVQFGETSWIRRSPATLLAAATTGAVSLIDMTVVAEGGGFWLVRDDPAGGERVRIRAWAPSLARYVGSLGDGRSASGEPRGLRQRVDPGGRRASPADPGRRGALRGRGHAVDGDDEGSRCRRG